ncbi:periplasmic binding protein-like I [Phycomyces nitens]|nr:periplasmic binding protein-like I [Phycomyces nitens]
MKWHKIYSQRPALIWIVLLFATLSNAAMTSSTVNSSLFLEPDKFPTYRIGILYPDVTKLLPVDASLQNMIVASETAVYMFLDKIKAENRYPDFNVTVIRYYSDAYNQGRASWEATGMIEDGIDAVVGDISSGLSEMSAAVTGIWQLPQCSSSASELYLSDKDAFPYFFRTIVNSNQFGEATVDWVYNMNWTSFAVVYSNDYVGQQALYSVTERAKRLGINAAVEVSLHDFGEDHIRESLLELAAHPTRVVVFPDLDPNHQIPVLKLAQSMGMLSEGWVWIVTNDISEEIKMSLDSPEDYALYNGLMMISGLWDLSGQPAYDDLKERWDNYPIPAAFTEPKYWKSQGLSYNAPEAYACAELLVLGMDKALNLYPGGRSKGLEDLKARTFNSSNMTPTFFNMNYTGPKGLIEFSPEGDTTKGYFILQYINNGEVLTYANIMANIFELVDGPPLIFLGNTHHIPRDTMKYNFLNPSADKAIGIVILALSMFGIFCCLVMGILIGLFRNIKPIMAASPFFCYLQLLGLGMSYIAVTLYIDMPTPSKCIARKFIITIAFVLVMTSIIAKNYRIYKIFQNVFTVRTARLKSAYMLRFVGICTVIIVFPLIIWNALYRITVKEVIVGTSDSCFLCNYPQPNGNWAEITIAELVVLIMCALLIIVSSFLAYKTRRVRGKWSESNQIAYVSYNACLAACLATPSFFLGTENYLVAIYMKLAAIIFASTFTLIVLFAPKLVEIVKHVTESSSLNIWGKSKSHKPNASTRPEGHTTDEHYSSASSSEFRINNLVAKNLLDFVMEAYEGVLPVKQELRFDFFSMWELKQLMVVPLKRYFVLVNQTDQKAKKYGYVSCEEVSAGRNIYIFRVTTDKQQAFLFQVNDQIALDRWIRWFKGPGEDGVPSAVRIVSDNCKKESEEPDHFKHNHHHHNDKAPLNMTAAPITTFGLMDPEDIQMIPSNFVSQRSFGGATTTDKGSTTDYYQSSQAGNRESTYMDTNPNYNSGSYQLPKDDIGSFQFPSKPSPLSPYSRANYSSPSTEKKDWPRYD